MVILRTILQAWLKITLDVKMSEKNNDARMALYSPLNSLTPIKARLQRITLQHKVDTGRDLLYDLLFHMCVTVQNYLAGEQSQWDWPASFIPPNPCL